MYQKGRKDDLLNAGCGDNVKIVEPDTGTLITSTGSGSLALIKEEEHQVREASRRSGYCRGATGGGRTHTAGQGTAGEQQVGVGHTHLVRVLQGSNRWW
jgi:hypothetical protein